MNTSEKGPQKIFKDDGAPNFESELEGQKLYIDSESSSDTSDVSVGYFDPPIDMYVPDVGVKDSLQIGVKNRDSSNEDSS